MQPLATALGLALAALTIPQGQAPTAEPNDPTPLPAVPETVIDPPEYDASARPEAPVPVDVQNLSVDGVFDARYADDSVPLPIDALVEPGDGAEGDSLVARAAGNPYFLGFVGGKHFPPEGESVDPVLVSQVRTPFTDGRPAQETYGFVMFDKRITERRKAQIEALGARVLGFHPHYTLRVAIEPAAIDQVAALDFVRWVGAAQPMQKVDPRLQDAIDAHPGEAIDVWINVFDSDMNDASVATDVAAPQAIGPNGVEAAPDDAFRPQKWMSNGWQQQLLQDAGVEVLEYADGIRSFLCRATPEVLEMLPDMDFVQFIEPELPREFLHDESVPMINSDVVRATYTGGTSSYSIAGFADSGYYFPHWDLNHIQGWGWDFAGSSGGAWDDDCGHGSHVAGTILGEGDGQLAHMGNAPELGWGTTGRFYNAKIGNDTCGIPSFSLPTMMSVFANPITDGSGNVTPLPHVVNHSWGTRGTNWTGTSADARTVDGEVFANNTMHVWAAGNNGGAGAGSVGEEASAKNAFSVANVVDYASTAAIDGANAVGDPGTRWWSSSMGPTGDGRWKPNIAAPGRMITSVDDNTSTGYVNNWGTSMAAPHVTGAAAQILDAYNWLGYAPARLASLMMATAITKDDQTISAPTSAHLDLYGAGRVEPYRAIYGNSQYTWSNWGFTLNSGQWTYADFTVNPGCTRIVVCMHYVEDAASSGASQALVNDWDLWIDQDPVDTTNGNTGEWFIQQSTLDNTEIRVLNNPIAGPWRWKIWPDSTSSSAKFGVTVSYIYADTTPSGSLTLNASDTYVQPNDDVDFTATAFNPDYVASAVYLDSDDSGGSLQSASTTLWDGAVTDLTDNMTSGTEIMLGDIFAGVSRTGRWTTRWGSEGVKNFSVNARSDNWVDRTTSLNVVVDGTDPGEVTNLGSSTHTVGAWSNDTTITFTWNSATDNLSGVSGYGDFLSLGGPSLPGQTQDIAWPITSAARVLSTSTAGWYFNLRTVDRSGNWDSTSAETGPYFIDTVAPTAPSGVVSTTHTIGVENCNDIPTMVWTAASDSTSGLGGYIFAWDHSPTTQPTGFVNLGASATSVTTFIGSSSSSFWFHLRAVDQAGNLGPTVHSGPYFVDTTPYSSYCTAKVNSQGCTPAVGGSGQPKISGSTMVVTADLVLNQKNGIMFWGTDSNNAPFQGGILCVKQPTIRTAVQSSGGNSGPDDCSGFYSYLFSSSYMSSYGLSAGDSVYCQYWSRDPQSPSTTGLTDGLKFTICQ